MDITYIYHATNKDVVREVHGRITLDKGGDFIFVRPIGAKFLVRIKRSDITRIKP